MSILGEYLQRVKAERDEAVRLLRQAHMELVDIPSWDTGVREVITGIEAFLSRYDLPDDYDEA
jgi:hypothetical protein